MFTFTTAYGIIFVGGHMNNKSFKIDKEVHEELLQEKFRKILIENKIANTVIFKADGSFMFDASNCICATYIYKDNDDWVVCDVNERGVRCNIEKYANQVEAYTNLAQRKGIKLDVSDISYDINNISDMLVTLMQAKVALLHTIMFYGKECTTKLQNRYLLLDEFEKNIIEKNELVHKKIKKKKDSE